MNEFEELYNIYCYYSTDYGGMDEQDGDPRNYYPLNYEKTVKLMKKLYKDFTDGTLNGSVSYLKEWDDGEKGYLVIKAYPTNCDTDTLILKSYDWSRLGLELKAGEIYP